MVSLSGETPASFVLRALQNPTVVSFVKDTIKSGYSEFFTGRQERVFALVDDALDALRFSQRGAVSPQALHEASVRVLTSLFKKDDPSFWFNRVYQHYKCELKPEVDLTLLSELIRGQAVLDYGCGSGYLALRLEREGYTVYTTDVLDYRLDQAKHLPFQQMDSPLDIPFSNHTVDTAIVQAVLHHIDPGNLPGVIKKLARIAQRVLIKEDTYNLPFCLDGLRALLDHQPLLRAFIALPLEEQFLSLALIDYYANVIAQGIPEMNLPFQFKSVPAWVDVLKSNGLSVIQTILTGFGLGRMHKSCHVWMVCERQRP